MILQARHLLSRCYRIQSWNERPIHHADTEQEREYGKRVKACWQERRREGAAYSGYKVNLCIKRQLHNSYKSYYICDSGDMVVTAVRLKALEAVLARDGDTEELGWCLDGS